MAPFILAPGRRFTECDERRVHLQCVYYARCEQRRQEETNGDQRVQSHRAYRYQPGVMGESRRRSSWPRRGVTALRLEREPLTLWPLTTGCLDRSMRP